MARSEYCGFMADSTGTEVRLRLGLRLTPHQTAKARADLLRMLQDNLRLAQEVLDGRIKCNSRQTLLFLRLLNKVIPPAVEPQPEPEGNINLPNFSVADLRRMLAETLGEEGTLDDSSATLQQLLSPTASETVGSTT